MQQLFRRDPNTIAKSVNVFAPGIESAIVCREIS